MIARAEGEKRARIASAEADAETTRLEGGAEAQIVLTKGEAEAKALAMRADAYKQFNEAAIIQTVLAALPDIVKAAAEPMGHIDSLTVMSADGASDVVRNATRAMIESTTAIKGLTGLDVPNLIGGALGRTVDNRREGNGEAGAGESAAQKISDIAAQGLTTMKAQATASTAHAKSAADEALEKAEAEAAKAKEAAAKAAAAAESTAAAAVAHVVPTSGAAPVAAAAPTARVAPADGNVSQWAKWLADQLHRIPNIEVYDALPLAALESQGPASARGVWATAKAALAKDYSQVTIGDLLKRFRS